MKDVVGKDDSVVDLAVPIGVFQETNPASGGLSGQGVLRVVSHFRDKGLPRCIEHELNGIHNLRLCCKDLDPEIFVEPEASQCLLRRKWSLLLS
ncbi:MAG: hypothetical protein L0338_10770 [Acidobacteria bacterium]|nr:hypothetical protein [Acidobacteriota bacterium]